MKFLVACELPEDTLDQLRALAADVILLPEATTQDIRDNLAGVSILIVAGARVSAEAIARARALQLIVRAGCGPGEIAIEEASLQGIFVTHCPDTQSRAIAELAFGLLLALDRRIVESTLVLREGRWARSEFMDARGLAGRTLGILGFGSVARLVARRARAFDMRVLAWSPRPIADLAPEGEIEFVAWPRELARLSDFVTVLSLDDGSERVIDADFLDNMPEGAALVHVGDPGAVDENALVRAIEERKLRVALDAFTSEPAADSARFRCRLCEFPGVIGTQHLASATAQAREATAAEVVRIVRSFVVSGELINCLNLCERSPATWQLVLRVRDQVGVMAAILETVRADGINAQEINSRVFTGAKAAWCTIAMDERPSTEALDSLRALPDVLHLELRAVV